MHHGIITGELIYGYCFCLMGKGMTCQQNTTMVTSVFVADILGQSENWIHHSLSWKELMLRSKYLRASLAKDAGFTGITYQFGIDSILLEASMCFWIQCRMQCIISHWMFSVTIYMHNIPLNVVGHHLYRYLDREILPKLALEVRERQYHGCQVAVNNTDLHMYLHHACMFFTLCGYWFNCITVKIVHDDKDQSNYTLYINSFFLSKYLDGFLMVWQRDWMLESRRVPKICLSCI